uniref:Exostosin GT47 domain-containing protein n=1 Tax=viral metagenome TaxID=1070528 RepID=A0A6C0JZA6_9ZZZZ
MFSDTQIIKGERLQQLTGVYIGYSEDFCYNPLISGEHTKQCNIHSITTQYDNPRVIFCYTHRIDAFAQIIKYFKNPFILITHNSDGIIENNSNVNDILDSPNLVKWYAQNVVVCHEKLRVLPIGIANDQWPHGNTDKIMENIDNPKTKKVYFNFNIATNPHKRRECYDKLLPKLSPNPAVSPNEYHKILSQYEFCICPEGNGVDTHRLWEALYLKCIPIVLQSSHIDILRTQINIPMVILQSWDEMDISKLDYNSYQIDSEHYYIPLSMDYYKEQIAQDVENLSYISKKNITLIPSVIDTPSKPLSYHHTRSVYTKQERFEQTKATIESVKSRIPNNKIMLIECSPLTEEENIYFLENTDIFINLYELPDKSYIEKIHSHSKSLGEGTMTIYALEYLIANNIPYDTLYKLSGRYRLTHKFSYAKYNNNDKVMIQYYCNRECASTILYKLPKAQSLKWCAFLQKSNYYFENCYGYENIFAMFLKELEHQSENQVMDISQMGVCGNISVCGGYVEG